MRKSFSFGDLAGMESRLYGYGRKPGLSLDEQRGLILALKDNMRKKMDAKKTLDLVAHIVSEI